MWSFAFSLRNFEETFLAQWCEFSVKIKAEKKKTLYMYDVLIVPLSTREGCSDEFCLFALSVSLSSLALEMWRVYIFYSSDVCICYTMCRLWCVIRRNDWLRIYSICCVAARAAEIWKEKRESQCVLCVLFYAWLVNRNWEALE